MEHVARANRARSRPIAGADQFYSAINWTIVAATRPGRAPFPELPQDAAVAALWGAIFKASRVEGETRWRPGLRTMRHSPPGARC